MTILCAVLCAAQTTVVLAPVPQLQFLSQSGVPLAFGCVFSYQSQTVTPLATYTDHTGTHQNPNPVPLSAGGSANIWLQAGQAYTLLVKGAGGTNCATGMTLYSIDGVGGGSSQQTTTLGSISGSASFTVQSQNQLFTMTLTGNLSGNPISTVGVVAPALITFQITQDGVGSHSFSWPANAIGGAVIGSSPNQVTTQMFLWNGLNATAIGPGIEGNGPIAAIGTLVLSSSITAPAFTSNSANPALSGIFRMASGDGIGWRNAANSGDLLFSKDGTDSLVWPNGLKLGGGTALATTNQSGTGSIVLATSPTINSPTLTSPNLGAATATSLNCPIISKTGAYTLTTTDCIVQASVSGGGFTLSIPHANSGYWWQITRTDASANALTIAGDSGNINGAASIQVPPNATVLCHADGTSSWCGNQNTRDFSLTGCTTAASTDSSCTGTITISPGFPDTNYFPQLTINSTNGAFVAISISGVVTSSTIPYTITCTFNCGSIAAPTIYVHAFHP